ncbi:hypothetical protein ACH5RR_012195 [Cinchona calisaya]|uniref:KIB1-4 beta-propeller domain-containing protein n=1 Tax=Cinchona calisaya TaxID=153742 RepID=A0ABD3A8K9_9GENT
MDDKCIGSSHGCVAFVKQKNCSIYLSSISPNNPRVIKLPRIEKLPAFTTWKYYGPTVDGVKRVAGFVYRGHNGYEHNKSFKHLSDHFFGKIVLSSAPKASRPSITTCEDEDCTVVMTTNSYNSKLAFCKIGDDSCTHLEEDCFVRDVVYSSKYEKFYTLVDPTVDASEPRINIWDLRNRSSPKMYLLIKSSDYYYDLWDYSMPYLLELSGEFISWFDAENQRFNLCWSLGDYAFFVGINESFALNACEYPGIKSNCIYYGDHDFVSDGKNYASGGHDFGIFNFKTKRISLCFPEGGIQKLAAPPVWVMPNYD